jgi:hypothetical protein
MVFASSCRGVTARAATKYRLQEIKFSPSSPLLSPFAGSLKLGVHLAGNMGAAAASGAHSYIPPSYNVSIPGIL